MRLLLFAAALATLIPIATAAQRPVEIAPNAPQDRPFSAHDWCQWDSTVRAMEPYVARARATYPAAKQRFLAGLPPGHTFFVTARLRDSVGRMEQVFVVVDTIVKDRIIGRIWSNILTVRGYRHGQAYEVPERELIDWMVARPDGSEEGNIVGNFLDNYQPPACADIKEPAG